MVFKEEIEDILRRSEACASVQLKNWNERSWPACFGQPACLGAVTGEPLAEHFFDLLTSPYIWGSLFN